MRDAPLVGLASVGDLRGARPRQCGAGGLGHGRVALPDAGALARTRRGASDDEEEVPMLRTMLWIVGGWVALSLLFAILWAMTFARLANR